MNRKLILPAIAAFAAAALAVPSLAQALSRKIVEQKTIAGIGLKLTPDQVKHRLGKPSHTTRVSGKIAELEFDKAGITVQFDTTHHPDLSNFIAAHTSRYRTSRGIHPGSTVAALKRAYRGKGLKRPASDIYTLFKGTPGAVGSIRTDFGTFEGKVSNIDIQTTLKDF